MELKIAPRSCRKAAETMRRAFTNGVRHEPCCWLGGCWWMQGGGDCRDRRYARAAIMLGPVSCRCTPVTSIIGLVLVYALIRAYNDGRLTFPFDRRSPYLSPTLDHPLPPSSLTYVAAAAAFIGGYTVAGNAL